MRQQLKRLENAAQRDHSRLTIKSQLIAIVAALLVVGCATTQQPEPPTVKPEHSQANRALLNAARGKISPSSFGYEENIEAVKKTLADGTDVNAKSDYGWTPLHWAAWEGHKEIAELLIDKGSDVYAKDKYEWTPLHLAAQGGHKEIAELLIARRPYVDAGDYRDWTPLHWAACNSKRWAASRGHKEIVELLIAKGANVNARTENGRGITPLDMANDRIPNVQKGDRETADLLRKHGGKTRHEL